MPVPGPRRDRLPNRPGRLRYLRAGQTLQDGDWEIQAFKTGIYKKGNPGPRPSAGRGGPAQPKASKRSSGTSESTSRPRTALGSKHS